jgi:hypothetical protein
VPSFSSTIRPYPVPSDLEVARLGPPVAKKAKSDFYVPDFSPIYLLFRQAPVSFDFSASFGRIVSPDRLALLHKDAFGLHSAPSCSVGNLSR